MDSVAQANNPIDQLREDLTVILDGEVFITKWSVSVNHSHLKMGQQYDPTETTFTVHFASTRTIHEPSMIKFLSRYTRSIHVNANELGQTTFEVTLSSQTLPIITKFARTTFESKFTEVLETTLQS